MTVDTGRYVNLMDLLLVSWINPLQIGVALYFLWGMLGPSIMIGFAAMLLILPVQLYLASKIDNLEVKLCELSCL